MRPDLDFFFYRMTGIGVNLGDKFVRFARDYRTDT